MSHYFIHDENMESNVTTIEYEFGGYTCSFKTDNGLFSKEHVDYATNILLHQLPELHGKVLDLGCGYGPIGIILSKVNDIRLTWWMSIRRLSSSQGRTAGSMEWMRRSSNPTASRGLKMSMMQSF